MERREPRAAPVGLAIVIVALALGACGSDPPSMSPPDAGTDADDSSAALVASWAEDYETAMIGCPERVWPAPYDWRSMPVLFVHEASTRAWLWNAPEAGPGALTPIPYDEVPLELLGPFGFGEFRGAETLSISVDVSVFIDEQVELAGLHTLAHWGVMLAFHEAFHFYSLGQPSWPVSSMPGARGDERDPDYPEDWEPRYLRHQVFRYLEEAYLEDDEEALRSAAFFFEALEARFPDELERVGLVDIMEGTAQYVQAVASALAVGACPSEDALHAAIRDTWDGFVSGAVFNRAAEPYDLGLVAGLLLRRGAVDRWEAQVMAGASPARVLLERVTPLSTPDDEDVRGAARFLIDRSNRELDRVVGGFAEAYFDPEAVRVVVPWGTATGSFGVGRGAYLREWPGRPHLQTQVDGLFLLGTDGRITLTWQNILEGSVVGLDEACPGIPAGSALVFPVPPGTLTQAGDRFSFATTTASGEIQGRLVEGADDSRWLCPP